MVKESGKRIGLSYWGFCQKFEDCNLAETPDGVRFARPILLEALHERGHRVLAMQEQREAKPHPKMSYRHSDSFRNPRWTDAKGQRVNAEQAYSSYFPDIDVLFVEWRWPTYKNSGPDHTEPDWDRQVALLDYYCGKVPVVAWDSDYKITPEDEERWPQMIVADPALKPRRLTRDRLYLPFFTDWRQFFGGACDYSYNYTYIGNNYERDNYVSAYYGQTSRILREHGINTALYGNWLNESPERKPPSHIIQAYPSISFCGRIGFQQSMQALHKSICTTHLQKKVYFDHGFVTARFFENLACGTPALVPKEFAVPEILGKEWIVSDAKDVVLKVKAIANMDQAQRNEIVAQQAKAFKSTSDFSVKFTVDTLESFL